MSEKEEDKNKWIPRVGGYSGTTGRDWPWRSGMRPKKYLFPEQWKTKQTYDENFDRIDWTKKTKENKDEISK